METCFGIQRARPGFIALTLIVFSALSAARSFTASIDPDHTAMTESYLPFNITDLEEITALPTEFVSTASSSTRGTVTDWGNSASTEITDPFFGFSEEQLPPTEANLATEVNANTGAHMDTERWESPALTEGAYTSAASSRAGERTLLSVTTNSTAPYTDNSSPFPERSPYAENTPPFSKNTTPYSQNPSSYSEHSSYSDDSTKDSDNISQSENTSSYAKRPSLFLANSTPYSDEFNAFRAYSHGFSVDGLSETVANGVSTNGATLPGFDQSGATSDSFTSRLPANSTHFELGPSVEISQQATGTVPDSTSNSTPPLTVTDAVEGDGIDGGHFDHTSREGTHQSETGSLAFSGSLATEEHTPNTSRAAMEGGVTSFSSTDARTEFSTELFDPPAVDHTQDTQPHTEDTESHTPHTQPHTEDLQSHTQDAEPHTQDTELHTQNAEPHTHNTGPHTPDTQPHTENTEPHTRDTEPHTHNTEPHTEGTQPHKHNTQPHTEDTESHTQDTEPHTQDKQPHTLNTEPHTHNTEPHTLNTEPHTHNTEPHTLNTEPNTHNTEPHTHNTEPHTLNTEPNTHNTEPHIEGTEPHTEGTVPHTEGTVPHTQEDEPGQAYSTLPPVATATTTVPYDHSTAVPITPPAEGPAENTRALAATLTTAAERTQFVERDTTSASTTLPSTSPTPYLPSTSAEPSTQPVTTTISTSTSTSTSSTTAFTTSSTAAPPAFTSPKPHGPPSTTELFPPSQTSGPVPRPSTASHPSPTDSSTLRPEITVTHPAVATTAFYRTTTPGRTLPATISGKHTGRDGVTDRTTTTQTSITSTLPSESPCHSNPCRNGGTCVSDGGKSHRCLCLPSWSGPDCDEDADECVSAPCPSGSKCVNTRGSFSCLCPLGLDLEHGRVCTRARTFLGTIYLSDELFNASHASGLGFHQLQREIILLLNASLSPLKGYSRSTLNKSEGDGTQISVVHTFAMSADVTSAVVTKSIERFLESCSPDKEHCRAARHHSLSYKAESLCLAIGTQCDPQRTNCTDADGTISCQCYAGYFKHSMEDLTCRECEDGYKLENGTCVRCMFGFGGFNCGNFYKLIAVVVSSAGGVLLLILIIALIVTCCRKDKNDISKMIFKGGDFQLSPYAEYPKSNRVSMEWGRETIEMQENGSTKNLLQMTDIYYSPALRNLELERSGLYPFSGVPGSRHSCIYPAQWNPSFICDDTRRRDYF
ncbi:hypothetical protein GJAV_G00205300 [Gymnothorax javanicus]|nr:hypothetical protein GJAV_G00205300 [Gymnothorax javanicus]